MGAFQTGRFRFGDFLLDVRERSLLKGGEPRYLPPRTFDTLLALVSRAGRGDRMPFQRRRRKPSDVAHGGRLGAGPMRTQTK